MIVHGTAGVDGRGAFHERALHEAGIATFEVDFKSDAFSGPRDRPTMDTFVPMAFAALLALRARPEIDSARAGIMGFSLGGFLSVTTALDEHRAAWMGDAPGFAAHVAFYPVCRFVGPRVTGAPDLVTGEPVLVLYGERDSYGDGEACPAFEAAAGRTAPGVFTFVRYAGAHHGFDRRAPASEFLDRASLGGRGYIEWNEASAFDARNRTVRFFREVYGLVPSS